MPLPAAELLALNLKRLRDERGLSTEDVVRLTGISLIRLEAIEAAATQAHLDEVGLLALALGVRLATLFAAE
ncbi:MAG: helix-turn-helix transcriptional regulator [Bosea sp.]|uniref:helix-turn-helix transcriptional regulator n=1 Tax=Bosea sp. (in: a-proteobacteria) TaxID=1871050 RepID=UPI00239D42BC|nr:helix-turn-helix transcriptional regulator [Bosea sp. (in: a-proteobacteria)]MCP4735699.1 helix-turn-helix transcriptional regulator [Bosea sp. (in: a-proteobacteria)]